MELGERVHEGLAARGLTLRAAARALHYDAAYLSRVLAGRQRPSEALVAALDGLLGTGGQLAQLVPPSRHVVTLGALAPDPEMYGRMERVVADPAKADHAVVDWLEQTLADHRRAEDTVGGKPLVKIVKAQVTTVRELGRHAPPDVRDRLVLLASSYAQFMAWICNDLGDKGSAVAWYDRAHDWALEARDVNMAATTLSMKAHIAWSLGDGRRAVRMGEAARWYGRDISPGISGMAAQMGARGHALLGEAEQAHRLADEAQALVTQADDHPEDEPDWMYFYGEDWFTGQRGMIELDLGNGPAAVDLLQGTMERLPERYIRDRAWWGTLLAKAHAVAGDLGRAADLAVAAAPAALDLNIYAVGELRQLSRTLHRRWPAGGRALDDALRSS
jgi:transcriptional regulator with XRE-family HTH domain